MHRLFVIICFSLSLNLLYSNEQISDSVCSKEENRFRFYEFVIDKYINLIKDVEMGDDSFFVLINDLLISDDDSYFEITISYTDGYKHLLEFDSTFYYNYSKNENVYIVLNEIQGDSVLVNDFIDYYKIKKINDIVLEKIFYPNTFEHLFHKSNIKIDNSCYDPNDIFSVSKIEDTIYSSKNGKGIVFFTDY